MHWCSPSWGGIIFSSEVGAQLLLFNSLVQRSNSDMYCFQCVLHYGAKMAIKNMCTSQKNTQRDTEPWDWIRHHTLCWVQLIRRTTSLFNGCQRRICPGLKPRLPAATRAVRTQADVAASDRARSGLTKKPYKRQVGITDVSYKPQRKYRCKANHKVDTPASVLPAA